MPTDSFKNYTNSTDKVKAIKENDEGVMKSFYQANYQKVETYVLNNSGTGDEAKDVYQEAFIAVWRNIKLNRFEPETTTSLEGYLFQVAKNKWLDHLRTIKRKKVLPLTEETNGVEETLSLSEVEEQQLIDIKTNLQLLGKICRDVLDRFYYQRQSMKAISMAMKWTESTAKNNKYRCLQRLRELLKSNTQS